MPGDDFKIIQQLLGSFGFPIFVAVWLLWERKTVANILINRMDELIILLRTHNTQHLTDQEERKRDRESH